MEVGDDEVLTLSEAAKRIGISRGTLVIQARNGALRARKSGAIWLVTASELKRYDEQRKEPRGFAREDHPLHGKRGGGGRKKSGD